MLYNKIEYFENIFFRSKQICWFLSQFFESLVYLEYFVWFFGKYIYFLESAPNWFLITFYSCLKSSILPLQESFEWVSDHVFLNELWVFWFADHIFYVSLKKARQSNFAWKKSKNNIHFIEISDYANLSFVFRRIKTSPKKGAKQYRFKKICLRLSIFDCFDQEINGFEHAWSMWSHLERSWVR